MGSVQAKSVDPVEPADDILLKKMAVIERIHIDGVGRTKEDLIMNSVSSLFEAKDFYTVLIKTQETKEKLQNMGCFKKVEAVIDTSRGPGASPDGLEVTFVVQELKAVAGGINTLVGNNEGAVVVNARLPNALGRGDSFSAEYSYGTNKSSGFNATFLKPLHTKSKAMWNTSVYQQMTDFPQSGYKELDRGTVFNVEFNSFPKVRHTLSWEGVWRDLRCINRTSAFAVREYAGHTLKSSLKHTVLSDTRDSNVFPTRGLYFRLSQEYAGFAAGDVGFLKQDVETQLNIPLIGDSVLQAGLAGGHIQHLPNGKTFSLQDRNFLGGPLNVRGFEMRGVGPHSDGNAVGGETYWAAGAHLFTPLPFRPGKEGFGDLFRSHFFVTAGNLGNFRIDPDLKENLARLAENFRLSYGLGIALKLGEVARIELNYCWPQRVQKGDKASQGVQFGVGVHFL